MTLHEQQRCCTHEQQQCCMHEQQQCCMNDFLGLLVAVANTVLMS